MSGWIKLEKDLLTDRRFGRMVDAILARNQEPVDVTQVRFTYNKVVTQVLGGIAQLWMFADTHIREDDTLDLGANEVDQLVGIMGFTQLMPADWLQIIDEHRIKLPGFQEHNGTEAKKKALTAKRVERHRIRNVTQQRNDNDTSSNAPALPDQTRLDHSQTRPEEGKNAREKDSRGTERHALLVKLRNCYPAGTYRDAAWLNAERAVSKLVDEGVKPADLVAAALAYGMQQLATSNVGTQFILSPERFFGTDAWRGPFPTPATPEEQAKAEREKREAAAMQRAKDRAAERLCPLVPLLHESAAAYDSRIDTWLANNRNARSAGPVAIAAALQKAAG